MAYFRRLNINPRHICVVIFPTLVPRLNTYASCSFIVRHSIFTNHPSSSRNLRQETQPCFQTHSSPASLPLQHRFQLHKVLIPCEEAEAKIEKLKDQCRKIDRAIQEDEKTSLETRGIFAERIRWEDTIIEVSDKIHLALKRR